MKSNSFIQKINLLRHFEAAMKAAKAAKSPMPVKNMGILDHIEQIVEASQKQGIDVCLSHKKQHIGYVSQRLGISPLQVVLFSNFVEKSDDSRIMLSEVAESIKCNKVRIIKYMNECEELEKKKLIRCSRSDNRISYRVPYEVMTSLRKHNEYRPEEFKNISIDKFFTTLERLFSERENSELTFESLYDELTDLINTNMQLTFCKKIMSYNLHEDDFVLLICFCHLAANNNDDNIGIHDFEFIFEDKCRQKSIRRDLLGGRHPLIYNKYIEYNNNGGFVNNESYRLSDMAKKELLSELTGYGSHNFQKNLILFENIKIKKMFYNEKESDDIAKLTLLLQEENFHKIEERLNSRGMRKGFACLFSGAPGTGKTETAYQIARETKRHILLVDIAETKSMWYGESEKKIKEIFNAYQAAVDNSAIAPILLFNEADAVIGKRKIISGPNSSIDQTENTIQNIILQEMENLSGILIATTNLSQNMDNAFERRFLYKINFEKPGIESRRGIWTSLLPDMPENETAELSRKFELSGGQIENISRKVEVDTIISGASPSMQTLSQYCRDELRDSLAMAKKIGFEHG